MVLTACGPKVVSTVPSGAPYTVTEIESCYTSDRSCTKWDTKKKKSVADNCRGKRDIKVQITPITITYEDGTSRQDKDRRVLDRGTCKKT